jgi:uncharacterized membrane protein
MNFQANPQLAKHAETKQWKELNAQTKDRLLIRWCPKSRRALMQQLLRYKRHIASAAFVLGLAFFSWLALTSSTQLRVVAGVILAAMLFYLRKSHQVAYGAIEVVAGAAVLAAPVTQQTCGTFAESC